MKQSQQQIAAINGVFTGQILMSTETQGRK
jgi:hypothetical protein